MTDSKWCEPTPAESPLCNDLANAVSDTIVKATHEMGLSLDIAVCVVAAVAADYARADIGEHYLEALAEVVLDRADRPPPTSTPLPETGRA